MQKVTNTRFQIH